MITEDEVAEVLNREIVRELMMEVNPVCTADEVDFIWKRCQGNPWNAKILYSLINNKE